VSFVFLLEIICHKGHREHKNIFWDLLLPNPNGSICAGVILQIKTSKKGCHAERLPCAFCREAKHLFLGF
jgi:hypothetical protein